MFFSSFKKKKQNKTTSHNYKRFLATLQRPCSIEEAAFVRDASQHQRNTRKQSDRFFSFLKHGMASECRIKEPLKMVECNSYGLSVSLNKVSSFHLSKKRRISWMRSPILCVHLSCWDLEMKNPKDGCENSTGKVPAVLENRFFYRWKIYRGLQKLFCQSPLPLQTKCIKLFPTFTSSRWSHQQAHPLQWRGWSGGESEMETFD